MVVTIQNSFIILAIEMYKWRKSEIGFLEL